jgi:hypothetical protein
MRLILERQADNRFFPKIEREILDGVTDVVVSNDAKDGRVTITLMSHAVTFTKAEGVE